jgi:hypothetical protein
MKRFGFWRRENKRIRAAEFLERGGRISGSQQLLIVLNL